MLRFRKITCSLRTIYKNNTFACNTVSCMTLMAAGDGVTQYMENKLKHKTESNILLANNLQHNRSFLFNYDFQRTANMFLVGSPLGIVQHIWYTYLDKKFPKQKTKSIIFKKVFIDQICVSPVINVFVLAGIVFFDKD